VSSYLCGWACWELSILSLRTGLRDISPDPKMIVQPLDRCMWQRLSINPTS
jgi:hypothetical protein